MFIYVPIIKLAITGFSPTQGATGDAITVFGIGFTGAVSAEINEIPIDSFVVVSDTEFTGLVGIGSTTGKVTITNGSEFAESSTDFFVTTGLVNWGDIGGDIEDQTDLKTELDNIRNDAIAYALIFG